MGKGIKYFLVIVALILLAVGAWYITAKLAYRESQPPPDTVFPLGENVASPTPTPSVASTNDKKIDVSAASKGTQQEFMLNIFDVLNTEANK